MAVNLIIYLLVLAALVGFYILYIDVFALIMLLCALALPLVLGGILIYLKCTSAAALTCDADTCSAGESIPVTLTIRSQSVFAFPRAQAVVELRHSFGAGKEKLLLRFPLQARNVTRITFYVHADFCGAVDISLKKIRVPDYFHLFRTGIRIRQKSTSILVLPKRLSLPVNNFSEPVLSPEGDVFGDRPGDDPSEIFGFHEYAPGEPVSRIHWKLSSKTDKLLMKEFSLPVQKSVLLLLDYSGSAKGLPQARIQEAETILTVFYSVVCQMMELQVMPTICWYHAEHASLEFHEISEMSQLTDVFRMLYEAISAMELDVQALMDMAGELQFSSVTCITNRLPQQLLQVIDRRITANQKTVLLVSGGSMESGFISEETSVLRVHPDSVQEDIPQLVI